jgi:NAD(P)-dependent dehydrogenase (short-subunit alcohol dehydrogenase family)
MITAATKSTLRPLAVTGATGAIGGQVARILANAGVAQRLLVRNVAKPRPATVDGGELFLRRSRSGQRRTVGCGSAVHGVGIGKC